MNHGDLMEAVVKVLVEDSRVQSLFGTDIGYTDNTGTANDFPWVFQDLSLDGAPFRDPKGTSYAAVVVSARDDWGVNNHNTMGLPIVRVFIFSDTTRSPDGQPVGSPSAIRRADRVFTAIDSVLHDLDNDLAGRKVELGEGRTVTFVRSRRRDGVTIQPVPNGDGMERLSAQFEVSTA